MKIFDPNSEGRTHIIDGVWVDGLRRMGVPVCVDNVTEAYTAETTTLPIVGSDAVYLSPDQGSFASVGASTLVTIDDVYRILNERGVTKQEETKPQYNVDNSINNHRFIEA